MNILKKILLTVAIVSIPCMAFASTSYYVGDGVFTSLKAAQEQVNDLAKYLGENVMMQTVNTPDSQNGLVKGINYPTGGGTYRLASSVSSSQTSIKLSSFAEPQSNTPYTMAYLNSALEYGTIDPGTNSSEFVSFSGITQNADGTATLTGVVRGLARSYPYTSSATFQTQHSGQANFVLSNPPQLYNDIYSYVNNVVYNGAPDASPTVKGIVEVATAAEAASNAAASSSQTTAYLALTSSIASSTSISNGVVITKSDGTIDGSFNAPPVGTVIGFSSTTPPTGYLAANGQSVSKTTYSSLFAVIGYFYGGSGGSFNLPNYNGRTLIGSGSGTKVATFVSRSSNVITVSGLTNAANNEFQTGEAVLYSAPSGAMTGLTSTNTYYIIRTGNLTFSLASSLANAQNGTAISLSSDGTGTQTFTLTLTARTAGDTGGEENHAMSATELLAHTHTVAGYSGGGGGVGFSGATNTLQNSGSTGGNAAMNVMNPFAVITYIIKY
jgi:microcystin-dependent protein